MVRDVIVQSNQTESRIKPNKLGFSIQQAQENIYQFLLEIVKKKSAADVLQEFKYLFIDYQASATNSEAITALSDLIFANQEKEFRDTIKRSCYIIINNWYTARNFNSIKELVELLAGVSFKTKTLSPSLNRQREWILNFIRSKEYNDLKLFIAKYACSEPEHWSNRYTSYLLVPQYTNLNNPIEQREAARTFSQKLKDQFKFDLAMYTARSQSNVYRDKIPKNPTALGDSVLKFIKMIVAKHGTYSYQNLAHIFREQTKDINYLSFKKALQKYLIFSVDNKDLVPTLNQCLAEKFANLYEDYDQANLDEALLLRSCNRVLEYLTTEDQQEPSALFVLLMSQGHHLTLVIVLLKVILISPNCRTHLETCIAKLIEYYSNYPEEECNWVITFFEVFKITFAIHADNVQYNLIKMERDKTDHCSKLDLDGYVVFSQLRG